MPAVGPVAVNVRVPVPPDERSLEPLGEYSVAVSFGAPLPAGPLMVTLMLPLPLVNAWVIDLVPLLSVPAKLSVTGPLVAVTVTVIVSLLLDEPSDAVSRST